MKKIFVAGAGLAVLVALATVRAPSPHLALSVQPTPTNRPSRKVRASIPLLTVYVAGAVRHPGLVRIPDGTRAADAVTRAGGMTEHADAADVNLAALLRDGDEVLVPDIRMPKGRPRSIKHARSTKHKRAHHAKFAGQLDLNRADLAALVSLPGIGATLAQRIITYREINGPFATVDGLLDVAGFSPSRLDRISTYIHV